MIATAPTTNRLLEVLQHLQTRQRKRLREEESTHRLASQTSTWLSIRRGFHFTKYGKEGGAAKEPEDYVGPATLPQPDDKADKAPTSREDGSQEDENEPNEVDRKDEKEPAATTSEENSVVKEPKRMKRMTRDDLIVADLKRLKEEVKKNSENLREQEELRRKIMQEVADVWGAYRFGLSKIAAMTDLSDSPDNYMPEQLVLDSK